MADERTMANGTLLPDVIRSAPDAQAGCAIGDEDASDSAQRVHRGALRRATYQLSILQRSFSLAQGLGQQMSGGVFEWVSRDNLDPGPPTGSAALSHGKIIVLRRRAGRARIGPACPTEWLSARGCSTPDDESVDNQEDE